MASRRVSPYAQACCCGAEDVALAAGRARETRHPVADPPKPRAAARGLSVPRWAVVLALALLGFLLCWQILAMRVTVADLNKQAGRLRVHIEAVRQENDEATQKIAQAGDPSRIHSLAVNRLGMHVPLPGEVVTLRPPQDVLNTGTTLTADVTSTDLATILGF